MRRRDLKWRALSLQPRVSHGQFPDVTPKNAPAGAQFAVLSLSQFDRVNVAAGKSKAVTLKVDQRRLQYWSKADNTWKYASGLRTLYVGASSRAMKLQTDIGIAAQ